MHRYSRKTAPKVRDGRVQKKNRHGVTAALRLVVRRERPGVGHRHVLTTRDVWRFVDIVPEWHELSVGLEQIILARGGGSWDGLYEQFPREGTAAIHLAAWPTDLWCSKEPRWFEDHASLIELFGVRTETSPDGGVRCFFSIEGAKAYTLLHVFLHELGHHRDALMGKGTDEHAPEAFALRPAHAIWPAYVRAFGDPRRANASRAR